MKGEMMTNLDAWLLHQMAVFFREKGLGEKLFQEFIEFITREKNSSSEATR